MRIAFLGLPLAALLLARDGHDIVWAGICRKDAPGTRRLKGLLGPGRVTVVPDLDAHVSEVRELAPDLIVSWFWTKKVPAVFRGLARHGAIGVHPSLLPRHRGPDPYFWTILEGDRTAGVTAHRLDDEYDTGQTLGQRTIDVDPSWNAWTLAKALDRPSLALLREVVASYANGTPPSPMDQDERLATQAPAPTDDDLELRWSDDAASIARRVRAASPWPGAFTEVGGEVLVLTEVAATSDVPKILTPGQAFVRRDGVAVIRTPDGAVELLRGRFDTEDDDTLGAPELAEIVDAARDLEGA